MSRACSTHSRENGCMQKSSGKIWRKNKVEDLSVDGNVILKLIVKKSNRKGLDFIHLAWVNGQWMAVISLMMSLRVL